MIQMKKTLNRAISWSLGGHWGGSDDSLLEEYGRIAIHDRDSSGAITQVELRVGARAYRILDSPTTRPLLEKVGKYVRVLGRVIVHEGTFSLEVYEYEDSGGLPWA